VVYSLAGWIGLRLGGAYASFSIAAIDQSHPSISSASLFLVFLFFCFPCTTSCPACTHLLAPALASRCVGPMNRSDDMQRVLATSRYGLPVAVLSVECSMSWGGTRYHFKQVPRTLLFVVG